MVIERSVVEVSGGEDVTGRPRTAVGVGDVDAGHTGPQHTERHRQSVVVVRRDVSAVQEHRRWADVESVLGLVEIDAERSQLVHEVTESIALLGANESDASDP
jgi:hypothetical protein